MRDNVIKKCKACEKDVPFDLEHWLVSGGKPAGKLCKACVAAKRRALRSSKKARAASAELSINIAKTHKNILVRMAKCILHINGIDSDTITLTDSTDYAIHAELMTSDFNTVLVKYLRGIK